MSIKFLKPLPACRLRVSAWVGCVALVGVAALCLSWMGPAWSQSAESSSALAQGQEQGRAEAQPSPQVDFAKLEAALMNPCENCGGKPLSGSYCGGATEAKTKMRRYAAEGQNEEQIVASFVAEYGEWILAVPEKTGFNVLAWAVPIGALLVGGGLLSGFLRQSNRARVAAGGSAPAGGAGSVPSGGSAPGSSPRSETADRPRLNLRREDIGDPGPAVIEDFLADIEDEDTHPQPGQVQSAAAGRPSGSDLSRPSASTGSPVADVADPDERRHILRERLARELEDD